MIWIIPKSLTSASALATAASTSDCIAASRICEQSLIRRSKRSRASCYLREWKGGRLTRLRSGLTSSLFLGPTFATEWICSQAAIRVSHSAAPGSDSAEKTLATSGPTSQMEFQFCDPGCASSRTSKDTSALDSEKSSSIWASLVTQRRGEYSARLKSARLTSGSASSSWPTALSRDWKGSSEGSFFRKNGKSRADQLPHAVEMEKAGIWPTPCAMEAQKAGFYAKGQMGNSLSAMAMRGEMSGPVAPASPSSDGSRLASWPTPSAMDGQRPDETPAEWEQRNAAKKAANPNLGQLHRPLPVAVQNWATPEAKNQVGYQVGQDGTKWPRLGSQVQAWATPRNMTGGTCRNGIEHSDLNSQAGGKLNPRWVETLMGLPVGWTMPSCASPVTAESTSSASSETASCPPSPSEPS